MDGGAGGCKTIGRLSFLSAVPEYLAHIWASSWRHRHLGPLLTDGLEKVVGGGGRKGGVEKGWTRFKGRVK